jgi:hypothetical protein
MADNTTSCSEGRRRKRTVDPRSHRSRDSDIKRPCSSGRVGDVADGTSDDYSTAVETPAAACEKTTPNSSSRIDDDDNNTNHDDESNTNTNNYQHHFSFPTNPLDHCETPKAAYQHVEKFLEVLFGFGNSGNVNSNSNSSSASAAAAIGKKDICIWDPFYCNGTVKKLFLEMGFPNVKNDNVDFYQLIQQDKARIPRHDVLVTNPPYSDNHIPRLLQFVVERQVPQRIPCCLLLPNWVARQADYVANFVEPLQKASHNCELFYLSPLQPYTYTMPSWVRVSDRPSHVGCSGKTTPYLSSWYIVVPSPNNKSGSDNNKNNNGKSSSAGSFLERMDAVSKQEKPHASWVVAKTVKGLKWKIKKHLQNNKHRKGRK